MFQKNPEGLVPIIETKDGKVLYESLVVADYLDAAYATKPLHPRDPYLKGIDKILIEKFSNTVQLLFISCSQIILQWNMQFKVKWRIWVT